MKYLTTFFLLFGLFSCAQDTTHTVDVKHRTVVGYVTPDGRSCQREQTGGILHTGGCTEPTLTYPTPFLFTILELNRIRDYSLYPCTETERWFLTNDICVVLEVP